MKKTILILYLSFLCTPLFSQETLLSVQNEFIKIIVNENLEDQGRFAIETTKGDPKHPLDDNQSLIYGRPQPWTSYSTLMIDKTPYVFGGKSKKMDKRAGKSLNYGTVTFQEKTPQSIITETKYPFITAIQKLSFFRNPTTRVKDSVLIEYTLINHDIVSHNVGLRIMLDTMLGSNDGAPFRIGSKAHTSEISFLKKELHDYWQTFDNLSSPNVIAQGILSMPGLSMQKPDHLHLVNWGSLAENPWKFTPQQGRSFIRKGEFEKDTALAMYWDPVTLAPDSTHTFQTIYGLGGVSLSAGDISLGITAPAEHYASSKDSFLVMGYIMNSGGFDALNTVISFTVPPQFVVVNGQTTIKIKNLKAGESLQLPLTLKLRENPKSGNSKLKLHVRSDSLEPNTISRFIHILAPPKLQLSLKTEGTLTKNNTAYTTVQLFVKNPNKHTLRNITGSLKLETPLELAYFEKPKKTLSRLLPLETKELSWHIKQTPSQLRKSRVRAQLSSKLTSPQRIDSNLEFLPEPRPLRFTISNPVTTENNFVTAELSLKKALVPGNTYTVQFDNHHLKPLRQSIHQPLLLPVPKVKLDQQPNTISLWVNNYIEPGFKSLIKYHFKTLKNGQTDLILKENDILIDIISIEIKQKEGQDEKIHSFFNTIK